MKSSNVQLACRLADHELFLPNKQLLHGTVPAAATAVAVTPCGHFGVVGTASGRVDKYNMQSGIHRGRFSPGTFCTGPPRLPTACPLQGRHERRCPPWHTWRTRGAVFACVWELCARPSCASHTHNPSHVFHECSLVPKARQPFVELASVDTGRAAHRLSFGWKCQVAAVRVSLATVEVACRRSSRCSQRCCGWNCMRRMQPHGSHCVAAW